MTWLVVLLIAVAAFAAIAFWFRPPRGGREAVAAALVIGIAGYALQGSPGVPAAPRPAGSTMMSDPAAFVEVRKDILGRDGPPGSSQVVIADAMVRHGQFADAVTVLQGAVEQDPGNAEAWVAMANALVAHADGLLTPAALHAFREAARADPGSPGAPFFLGLALAQSGQIGEARALWAGLVARAPADAPWKAQVQLRLERLDMFIAAQLAREQARGAGQ